MSRLNAVMTLISTLAAVVSAGSAIWIHKSDATLREKLEARTAIADWARNLNRTGGACAAALAQFSVLEFKEFVNRTTNRLLPAAQPFLKRCVVEYDKGTFDPEGDLELNESERLYIFSQVTKQLEQYELLALVWNDTGEEGRRSICAQASIPLNSLYREYRAKAEGTDAWKYPTLPKFMADCRP